MGPPSYMRPVVDRKVVMRRIHVLLMSFRMSFNSPVESGQLHFWSFPRTCCHPVVTSVSSAWQVRSSSPHGTF